jgi:CheY-like chemotaxis protein
MKRILLVDDDSDLIFVIKKFFEESYRDEYQIIPARNGRECFKLLEKEIPDLILLDIMMPEMDGWKVFDGIKANDSWKKIPIIILTARSDGFAENAGGLIADDFIKKPIENEELKSRIDNVLKDKQT